MLAAVAVPGQEIGGRSVKWKGSVKVLVIDLGETHVGLLVSGQRELRQIDYGPTMTTAKMVAAVKKVTADWRYDVVSIGYTGPVLHGWPVPEPKNLGSGFLKFDFHKAFRRPVKIVNDAAMRALGSYHGGRMLFLGLGPALAARLWSTAKLSPWSSHTFPTARAAPTRTTSGHEDSHALARNVGGTT